MEIRGEEIAVVEVAAEVEEAVEEDEADESSDDGVYELMALWPYGKGEDMGA